MTFKSCQHIHSVGVKIQTKLNQCKASFNTKRALLVSVCLLLFVCALHSQEKPSLEDKFRKVEKLTNNYKAREALQALDSLFDMHKAEIATDTFMHCRMLTMKSRLFIKRLSYTKANKYAQSAIDLANNSSFANHPRLGASYLNLAVTQTEKREYENARKNLEKAAYLYSLDSLLDRKTSAVLLSEFGILLRKQKKSNEAINFYLAAIEGFTANNDTLGLAKTHHNLGNVYYDIKENAVARRHYRLAEKMYDDNALSRKALAIEGIALTYRKERAFDLAIENLKLALQYFREAEGREHPYAHRLASKLAQDYVNKLEPQKAIDFLNQEGTVENSNRSFAVMTEAHYFLEKFELAKEYALKGLSLSKRTVDSIYLLKQYGDCLRSQNKIEEAEEVYRRNLRQRHEVFHPKSSKIQYAHLGLAKILCLKGNYEEGLAIIDTLLNSPNNMYVEIQNGNKVRSTIWDDLQRTKCQNLYKAYLNRPSQALWDKTLNAGNTYIKSIDTLRQNAVFSGMKTNIVGRPSRILEIMLELIYDRYKENRDESLVGRAMLELDDVRDMIWLDLVTRRKLLDVTAAKLSTLKKENTIRKRLAKLELLEEFSPDSIQIRAELFDLRAQLLDQNKVKVNSNHFAYKSGDELLKALRKDNHLTLTYFISGNNLFKTFVSSDTAILIKQEWTDTEENLIKDLAYDISSKKEQGFENIQQVSTYLFEGIPFPETGTLTIIPDGTLHLLPFEILNTSESNSLIENFDVVYNSSLKRHFGEEKKNKFKNEVIAFAPNYKQWSMDNIGERDDRIFPTLVRSEIGELPAAKEEVAQIMSLYKGKAFFDEDATIDEFLDHAGQSNIIHLSMHALADQNKSQLSRLVFSPSDTAQPVSRYFFASEIAVQDIPAELVVLSACNTGLGEFVRGDGVLSLSRAFEYAGARSTVFSLWKIPDAATKEVMGNFYSNLANGQPKHSALRQAKLSYIKKHKNTSLAHPYYWSGFVINGNTAAIPINSSKAVTYIIGLLLVGLILMLINRFYHVRQ